MTTWVSGITAALNGSPHVAQLPETGAGVGFRQRGQTAGCIRLPDSEKFLIEPSKRYRAKKDSG
jgi:hypothetical protein